MNNNSQAKPWRVKWSAAGMKIRFISIMIELLIVEKNGELVGNFVECECRFGALKTQRLIWEIQNASSAAPEVEASKFRSVLSAYPVGIFFFGAAGRGLGPFKLEHLQASLSSHNISATVHEKWEAGGRLSVFLFSLAAAAPSRKKRNYKWKIMRAWSVEMNLCVGGLEA
jgi:hypothetical protein